MNADLSELARRAGVSTSYAGWDEQEHTVAAATVVAVLASLGIPAATPEQIDTSLAALDDRPWRDFLPSVTVAIAGDEQASFCVHIPHGVEVQVSILTEDGAEVRPTQLEVRVDPRPLDGSLIGRATFAIPADLPPGYHRILGAAPSADLSGQAPLILTPARLDTADAFGPQQLWGLAVQLYSVRSAGSWGVGDFADLGRICEIAASTYGADFVQVNPLHAAQPAPPVEASPYLPVTRRFLNPLYIRVAEIPEVDGLGKRNQKWLRALDKDFFVDNTSAKRIKRNKAYRAKLAALELIHDQPRSEERKAAFREFRKREGKGLKRFATWCAFAERYGADDPRWTTAADRSHFIKRKRPALRSRIRFFLWLQWICDEQLAAAQRAAVAAGMRIGVLADLAVGVAQDGADVWTLGEVLATGMTVGAPPDGFNQQGQNWDQPPWHPHRLAEAGYAPYRDMLRTALRHAGGLRVDHILGLFRLWWIPQGGSAADGTYVRYDHDALIGILALEAQRAGAVVIGEDLGVFEPLVQETLTARGILGTSILWFEHDVDGAIAPERYRRLCLTSVTTHDLPPTLGYLAGEHLSLRSRLGLLETGEEAERLRDATERDAILDLARERGLLGVDVPLVDERTVDALYALIAASPSLLLSVALVDAVGERRIQNQPGTTAAQYPNWCIPLADADGDAVLVEDLASNTRFARLVAALQAAGIGGR